MENKNNLNLNKHMSPGSVWALAIGAIIGWGCFIQGAEWTRQAGGPLALAIGFLLGGGLMIVIGLSYSYLIPKCQVAGGEFAYSYYAFGRWHGFACGWMMLLGYITLAAMNATAVPVLASYVFPGVFKFGYLYTLAGYQVYLGEVLLSVFFLSVFAILNILGVRKTGSVQLTMAVLLCITVAIAAIGTLISDKIEITNLRPYYGEGKSLISGILSILVVTPYCFVGFDTIPQAAEEYNFDNKRVKRLIVSSLIVGAIIYIAMAVITDVVIPWRDLFILTDSDGEKVKWLTGAMLDRSMGRAGTLFVTVAVMMAICTGINGFYLAGSRLLFSMGRANMLPPLFGRLSQKHNTPAVSIAFIMMICYICPFFGRNVLGWVIDMCSVGTAVGYCYTCLSAYRMAKKDKKQEFMPLVAVIGAVISLLILALLVLPFSPAQMAPQSFVALMIWVGFGLLSYFVNRKRTRIIPDEDMDQLVLGKRKDEVI